MVTVEYPLQPVVGRPSQRLPELRRLRIRQALSQAELAERAGLSRHTIIAIETGRTGAQYTTIRSLAEALGVEPAALMGPEEQRS